jgi:hypothetical protein
MPRRQAAGRFGARASDVGSSTRQTRRQIHSYDGRHRGRLYGDDDSGQISCEDDVDLRANELCRARVEPGGHPVGVLPHDQDLVAFGIAELGSMGLTPSRPFWARTSGASSMTVTSSRSRNDGRLAPERCPPATFVYVTTR